MTNSSTHSKISSGFKYLFIVRSKWHRTLNKSGPWMDDMKRTTAATHVRLNDQAF